MELIPWPMFVFRLACFYFVLACFLRSFIHSRERMKQAFPALKAARDIGYQWTPDGLETLYIRSKVVLAACAAGVHPLVGVWQDVHDLEGLRKAAQFQRQLGFDGELLLHPSNVPVVNRIYGLTEEQIRYYEQMIEAYEQAARDQKRHDK